MIRKLHLLFKPPVFEDDDDKTHIANTLNTLLLSLIIGLVLIGFITRFERLTNYILSLLLTIGTWITMRRGYIRFASIAIVIGLSILLAIVVPLTGGVRATTYGGFMVVILLAGLILGQWASIIVAVFASLLGGILVGITSRGIWETPISTANDLTYWIVFTFYFFVSAIVLMLALKIIEDSYRKTKTELAERKRAEEELTVLYEIAMLTASVNSLEGLFEQISHKIDRHINTDLFSIWLFDKTNQILNAVSRHYHGQIPDWTPPPIPLQTGIIGTVASTGQAMRVSDVTKEPLYLNAYSEARSELCVPMRIGERVIGVINMESNTLNTFSEDDERLLSTIASQLAIAIERLRVEDALRESEEYYRSFVEKLPVGVYRVTPGAKGRHLIANAAYLRMFRINSLEELIQHDVASLYVNPSERKDFSDNLLTKGYVERAELHLRRFDGKPIWGAITASAAQGKDGEVFFDCVMEDITERKQAEEALKISEERLQQAVRASNIGIFDHDHLTDTIYWSAEQRRNYGWEDMEETVALDKFFNQIHPEDRERIIVAVQKAHDPNGDGFFDVEHRITRRDDEVRWLSTKSQTQFGGTGEDRHPFRTVGAVMDITERKQAEEKLRQSLRQLSLINESGRAVSALLDLNVTIRTIFEEITKIIDLDSFFIALYDASQNTVTYPIMYDDGQFWEEEPTALSDTSWTARVIHERRSILTNRTAAEIAVIKSPNKLLGSKKVSASAMTVPMIIGDNILGVVAIHSYKLNAYTDEHLKLLEGVTLQVAIAIENARLYSNLRQELIERKRTETELEKRNAELERFNYTVSHELKAPIVTMKGFIGSVGKDIQNGNYERAEKDLLRVSTAADKMHQTLLGLLELAQIGRVVTPPTEVDLGKVVIGVLETAHEQITSGNIKVTVSPDLPTVYGDEVRIREIYENLINNAMKHMGDQNSPQIEIGFRKDGDVTILFVKDNGAGIDPRYHARVFGLFDKLDAKSEGTGVGLTIVKRIIEIHGGKIWVESEGLGKGATFCFTLPSSSQNQ